MKDVYQRITDTIIASLENGVRPWSRPWSAGNTEGRITRPIRANGEYYSGINVLVLWGEALEKGYSSARWMTYKQALELGGQVRKGEKSSQIVYADKIIRKHTSASGEETEKAIPFLKAYNVFNIESIDGLPEHFYDKPAPRTDSIERIAHAEAFFKNVGSDIRIGGNRAFYSPSQDFVQMPPLESFKDAESFEAVLAHEHIHFTGHASRLNRERHNRFGDSTYRFEEMIAEMGSAFLCADLNLTPEVRPEHSSYLASWIRCLTDHKTAIFTAASHASRAVEFLHALQPSLPARPEIAKPQHAISVAPVP